MKPGQGKNKGSGYERKVSKILSLWWTENKDDDVFWLSTSSGARATTRAKAGQKTKYQYGDITFSDPIGEPFINYCLIECKKGYTDEINPLDFLDKKKGTNFLQAVWDKAEKERELANRKETILIFERNRRQSCMMMRCVFLDKLEDMFGTFDNWMTIPYENTVIILFDEFLDKVHPDFFMGQ